MKKVLFLLLLTVASYGQTLQNPTYGTVKLKNNTQSTTATKINVQDADGSINFKDKEIFTENSAGTLVDFNTGVRGATLTGFTSGAGTVSATDNFLQAIQKLNGNDALKANLDSPALTGTPTAPTATAGTNTTQVATTAFVTNAVSSASTSGNYTPTYSNLTNLSSPNTSDIHYTIVGKVVTVRGRTSVTLGTANTATSITLTLPFTASSVSSVMGNGTASQPFDLK